LIDQILNFEKFVWIILKRTWNIYFEKLAQGIKTYGYEGEFIIEFNVINEPWDDFTNVIKFEGLENYILSGFQKAVEKRDQLIQDGDPNIKIELGFSHAESHYPNGLGYPTVIEVLTLLEAEGIHLDYVDLHGHEKTFIRLQKQQRFRKAIEILGKFSRPDGLPIKVVVGEYDLNIGQVMTEDRLLKQAKRYLDVFSTLLDSGVKEITIWEVLDSNSWYETGESQKKFQKLTS